MDEIYDRHSKCSGICTRDALPTGKMESWARKFKRLDYLYDFASYDFYVDDSDKIMLELSSATSAEHVGKLLLEYARKDPNVAVKDGCNYRLVADHLAFVSIEIIEKVHTALNTLN
jgi:hypothetical protein